MYCDIIFIVWHMPWAHFNYVAFIHLFEDFNELNITVIVKIRALDCCYLGVFLLGYTFTEQLCEV